MSKWKKVAAMMRAKYPGIRRAWIARRKAEKLRAAAVYMRKYYKSKNKTGHYPVLAKRWKKGRTRTSKMPHNVAIGKSWVLKY